MLKKVALLVASVGLVMVASPAAFAQQCKDTVTATGRAAFTLNGAKSNAITNWRRDVVARYGEFYADFEKAKDGNVERCGKTIIGMQRCEASAKPCLTGTAPTCGEIAPVACKSTDSKECDPSVKAVQAKLTQKGCRTTADGNAGPSTVTALKCFQKKAKITESGEIDNATCAALVK
jgi:hypothetical protein